MFKKILIGAAALALAGGTTAGVVHVVRNSRTEAPEPEALEIAVSDEIEAIPTAEDIISTDASQDEVDQTEVTETSDGLEEI